MRQSKGRGVEPRRREVAAGPVTAGARFFLRDLQGRWREEVDDPPLCRATAAQSRRQVGLDMVQVVGLAPGLARSLQLSEPSRREQEGSSQSSSLPQWGLQRRRFRNIPTPGLAPTASSASPGEPAERSRPRPVAPHSRCLRPASGTWAVALALKRLAWERNASLTNIANQLPRLGHSEEAEATRQPAPNGEVEVDPGPPGVNLDQALETALCINDERQATKR